MNLTPNKSCVTAVLVPALLGLVCAYISVRYFKFYGSTLFIGVPLAVSFCSSLLYRRNVEASWPITYGVAAMSVVALSVLIFLFALDGLICILMALPLGILIAIPGSVAGYFLGKKFTPPRTTTAIILIFFSLPFLTGFERLTIPETPTHSVVSSVIIHAPIAKVWDGVITFDRISSPPRGIFRMGIAYPIEANIEGSGVGAIRRCVFTTGPFVEPITEWSEPHTLAFDVIENPPPMKELSIYPNLNVPHLNDTFTSTKGQFKLRQEGDKTILEGTTWYTQKLYPDWYWHHLSDEIIHRIHLRVLEHIKRETENNS